MNLQEIDRVLGEYGSVVLSREEFARAAAEIRRQALEEAVQRVVAQRNDGNDLMDTELGYNLGIREAAEAIRALAQPNGETDHEF